MGVSRLGSRVWRAVVVVVLGLTALGGSLALAQDEEDTPPAAPGAPTLYGADGQIQVSWSAPSSSSAITGYGVEYRSANTTAWSTRQLASAGNTNTSLYITGLVTGGTYQVRVNAANEHGTSGWSSATSGLAKQPGPPDAPNSIALDRGAGYIDVSWTAPSYDGQATITGYDISTSTSGPWGWTLVASNVLPTANSEGTYAYKLSSGIVNSSSYNVSVQARNSYGPGTRQHTSIAALTPPSKVGPISLSRAKDSLSVTWSAPYEGSFPITGYNIALSSDNKSTWSTVATGVLPTPSNSKYTYALESNISNTATYHVKVRAVSSVGGGKWSEPEQSNPIAPSAPPSVSVYRGPDYLDVEWLQGGGATSYEVHYQVQSSSSWTNAGTTTKTTMKISGTNNSDTYIVAVRSVSSNGESAWTQASPNYAASTPQAVTNLSAARDSAGTSIIVRWMYCTVSSSGCNGGSPITEYQVEYSTDSGSTWTRAATLTSYTSNQAVTFAAEKGTAYSVRVGVRNRIGSSSWVTVSVAAVSEE